MDTMTKAPQGPPEDPNEKVPAPPCAVDPVAGEADEFALGAGFDFADPSSKLARFYLRKSHVIAAVFLGLVFVLMSYLPIWHTDVWGHLRFGEYIVQNRQLPTREMFSGDFADQNAPYINYQWLAQAGAYLLFDFGRQLAAPTADARLGGGALMLTAAHAVIVTLRLIVLLFVFRRLTGSLPAAILGIVLVFAMSLCCHLTILRPQILGELAFAILLLPLSAPLLSRRALVLIPLLFVVWVNTHGSLLIGFVLLGLFLAGQAIEVVRLNYATTGWSGLVRVVVRDTQMRRLALVLVLSVAAAAALNPHGPSIYLDAWRLANHPNIRFLEEWKPLPWKTIQGYAFLVSVAVLLPVLWWSKAQLTVTQALLLLAFGGETLLHVRFLVWWIMVFAWVILPHLTALLQRLRLPFLDECDRPDLRRTILAVVATVSILNWCAPLQWLLWNEAPVGSRRVTEATPLKASAYLKRRYAADPQLPRCVFASETLGEYLLWDLRLDPPVRVFCYTHVHLLTPEHWQECMAVKNGDRGWQEILDRHGVAFLIVEPDLHPNLAKQVRAAEDRWEIVPEMGPNLVARRIGIPSVPAGPRRCAESSRYAITDFVNLN